MLNIGPHEMRNPHEAALRIFKGHTKGVYPLAFVPAECEETLQIDEDVEVCLH